MQPDLPARAPLRVYSLGPTWGAPSASPFATKLLTWLRMAEVPHTLVVLSGPPRSASGKIPYVELPDGTLLSDSGIIIERVGAERGVDLDAGLSPEARALGHAVRRMLEEHTYWGGVHGRWVAPEGFAATVPAYFGRLPALARPVVGAVVRRRMRTNLWGQGLGRQEPARIAALTTADVDALAALLGDRDHLLADAAHPRGRLATVDATMVGFLWGLTCVPFDAPLKRAALGHPNLVSYLGRMRARYWPELAGG